MTTRLFRLAFCFSFVFLCAPRLPLFPNAAEQDSLGHQNDCLEALGFGVGGWGAVVGLRFRRLTISYFALPRLPAAMLRKGVDTFSKPLCERHVRSVSV